MPWGCSIKTILLPFSGRSSDREALGICCSIAEKFAGYLEGLLVTETPRAVLGGDFTFPTEYVDQAQQQWREHRDLFMRLVGERGIDFKEVSVPFDGATAGWREEQGLESSVVGSRGRLFDLIVIGRSTTEEVDWEPVFEAALFEAGRPVLIVPPGVSVDPGKSVVIAWNGSTETSRTIGLGMPFLLDAAEVTVLTVEGGTVPGPSGQEVAGHLKRHGIATTAKTVRVQGQGIGDAIIRECEEIGADMLFKGAYTHSRLRQLVFGGATRDIMTSANIPVLMAH